MSRNPNARRKDDLWIFSVCVCIFLLVIGIFDEVLVCVFQATWLLTKEGGCGRKLDSDLQYPAHNDRSQRASVASLLQPLSFLITAVALVGRCLPEKIVSKHGDKLTTTVTVTTKLSPNRFMRNMTGST